MKKIALFVLVFGFVFFGCSNGTNSNVKNKSNSDPKSITITGLSSHIGDTIRIDVCSQTDATQVSGRGSATITGNSITIQLLIPSTVSAWKGNGSFYICLTFDGGATHKIYSNDGTNPIKYSINDAHHTIAFSSFVDFVP